MRREWLFIVVAVVVASVVFIFSKAETAAHLGWASLAFGLLFLGYVISTGIRAKRLYKGYDEESDAVIVHRIHIAVLTASILIGVVGIEIAVRKAGGLWGNPWMIGFHFVLVLSMATVYLLARFRMTGLRDPQRHRWVVYAFCLLFAGTFTTGTILLWEQFPPFSQSLAARGLP